MMFFTSFLSKKTGFCDGAIITIIALMLSTLLFANNANAQDSSNETHPVHETHVHSHGDEKPHSHSLDTPQSASQIELLITQATNDDDKVAITFSDKTILVEFADSSEERALGLMYRRSLCDDCGMLFDFGRDILGSIWMKNTYIPLDLAYINSDGVIVDIYQLKPFDLTPIKSSEKVLYALEMNVGWFAKYDIKVGQTVTIH